ncbi:hypothetical protein GH714_007967 [Hevea brasiliensis]|uniref:NADH dehydrogenase [ubiquinone] 1 beta subcomplex subunit 7 n=1 Tax=Hevea brasiliensis TaxID=3981 RepID=A0A6A6LWC1_HEVBR|nr:hypothetical protein GH714_007880 [Hevea brasiliensis]KAF2305744.1 hypothetical protein GH714_007967 [Hevea brasiliensis]
MEVEGSSKTMIATQAEMVEARVPISYRDQCAHLLIPLNKCRQAEFYLPWKCENERHVYEKCEVCLITNNSFEVVLAFCCWVIVLGLLIDRWLLHIMFDYDVALMNFLSFGIKGSALLKILISILRTASFCFA